VREEIAKALLQLLQHGGRGALATVVRASGSTPQKVGARLLRLPDGTQLGTVGGGAFERDVEAALKRTIEGGKAQLLSRELGYDLGMCCGGRMEVLVEPIEGQPRLVVCGAGHVAEATAQAARGAGFRVSIIDDREELNTSERFAHGERVLLDPLSWLKRNPLGANDWLLISTHDHDLDERLLEAALAGAARYIGMIGSKRKVLRIVQRIAARRGALDLDRVYAPVGLAIGGIEPGEIAASIAAELIALRRGARAEHLRITQGAELRGLSARTSEGAQGVRGPDDKSGGEP
jgi:xanthine dehydrogenase accessory factor